VERSLHVGTYVREELVGRPMGGRYSHCVSRSNIEGQESCARWDTFLQYEEDVELRGGRAARGGEHKGVGLLDFVVDVGDMFQTLGRHV
jgi:hypothetical protein